MKAPRRSCEKVLQEEEKERKASKKIQKIMGDLPQKELPTQKPESNVKTAIANIRFSDFAPSSFLNLACSKKALLYGGLAGTTIGVTRFMITRRIKTSGNYALLAFSLVAASSWVSPLLPSHFIHTGILSLSEEDCPGAAA